MACGTRHFRGTCRFFFRKNCSVLCHVAVPPLPLLCLGTGKGLGAHQERSHWHRESKSASAQLTHCWRPISQVCCFNFVFGSQFFKSSGKKGWQHLKRSQCNARMLGFCNSVPVLLFFNKKLEIKVERHYEHGGFAIKEKNEQR